MPCVAKRSFTIASDSQRDSAAGTSIHAASASLPASVIEYTVRRRRPRGSALADAKPCATSFFGSA